MAYSSCVTLCLLSLFLEVADVLTQVMNKFHTKPCDGMCRQNETMSDSSTNKSIPGPRVCIIGGGYSGLGTARYMKDYGLNFTVFEASPDIGGTWRFDPNVGIDENGIPLFTSQYKYLRTNTPRQTMEFSGYPFPEGTPSYPTGTCFFKYLKAFVKDFGLMDNIQLQSLVTSVRWTDGNWNITYMKADTKENVTEQCSFVVVASGQYSSPFIPYIEDQKIYKGKIMHSHDYKDPEDYRNQRVLLVGAGASGLDLSIQLSNVTSKLVHSHHLSYNQPDFPDNYVKKPDIKKFTATGAVFVDDSVEDFDIAIFCTGYNFVHPFLEQQTSGITATKKYVLPLYQQTVNIKYPSMTFVGVSKRIINRVLDAQGQYSAALAASKFQLPHQAEMLRIWLEHVRNLGSKEFKITDVNTIGDDMDNYFETVYREAGVNRAPKVLTIIRDFNVKNRLEDLLNYREYDYKITDDTHYERKYTPRQVLPCPIED